MGFKSLNGWRGTPMYCWRYERRSAYLMAALNFSEFSPLQET